MNGKIYIRKTPDHGKLRKPYPCYMLKKGGQYNCHDRRNSLWQGGHSFKEAKHSFARLLDGLHEEYGYLNKYL